MRSICSSIAFGSALLLIVGVHSNAQEKTGPNHAPPEVAAKSKATPDAEAVQKLHLAQCLIGYGRKNKVPEALITAARILASTSTTEMKDKPTTELPLGTAKTEKKDKPTADSSPAALLEEAKKLSKNDPAIVALANSIELPRGAVGGPKRTVEIVEPFATDVFKLAFRGDEIARVAISGDGDTRLDLYVYDENGNLITSHVGPGDDCLVSWTPKWTGSFTVKVVNRGRVQNKYGIATN